MTAPGKLSLLASYDTHVSFLCVAIDLIVNLLYVHTCFLSFVSFHCLVVSLTGFNYTTEAGSQFGIIEGVFGAIRWMRLNSNILLDQNSQQAMIL